MDVRVVGQYDTVASINRVFTTDVPFPITIDVPGLTALRDDYRGPESSPDRGGDGPSRESAVSRAR